MKTVGTNLAELRRKANYTQEQIAEKIGVTAQAVSKWENDLTSPDAEMLVTLSNIYGVSIDALLKGTEPSVAVADMDVIEKRLVHISVKSEASATNVDVRIPASVILAESQGGFIENIIIAGINPPEAAAAMAEAAGVADLKQPSASVMRALDMVRSMLRSGIVGEVINVNTDDAKIVITIEKYDGEI